ncbi:MAG: hypothetical protein LUB59_06105 [Candidatus Gastranaerophilales bacterium]|nr:hypothetical protein [Candidatus Gastranaerophilales bacterium]
MNISPINAMTRNTNLNSGVNAQINSGMTNSAPNFTAAPKLNPSYFSKSNAFLSETKKGAGKLWEKFIDNAIVKPIVVPLMNSKAMGKLADKSAKTNNMAAHMSTAGSFVTTAVYANRTLNNDNLDKKRARTLALNQVLVTTVSTLGAYTINDKLGKFSKNLGYKFREANQGNKNLTKRMQGFNIAKQLLIFSVMYRYVTPVLVTPLASKLSKCIDNKREENKLKQQNLAANK